MVWALVNQSSQLFSESIIFCHHARDLLRVELCHAILTHLEPNRSKPKIKMKAPGFDAPQCPAQNRQLVLLLPECAFVGILGQLDLRGR